MRRRTARELAVQSLYHMEMNAVTAEQAVETMLEEAQSEESGMNITPGSTVRLSSFTLELVTGTVSVQSAIDDLLADYLKGWQIERLSRVDRQILRLAVYEMVFRDDVPPRVAINEAIELAKHFGTEESGKFVNGVLGQMIKRLDTLKTQTDE